MPRKKTTKKKTRRNPSKGVKFSSYKPKKKTTKKTTNKYVTLKLPESLIKRIDQEVLYRGFTSRTDYLKFVSRNDLEKSRILTRDKAQRKLTDLGSAIYG